jgi:large subunit ribosomal protein L25
METKLTAERRADHGKGVARKLRAAGRVPAVLYGHGQETQALSVDAHDMFKVLHTSAGANVLVDLKVDKAEHLVLPREIQRNHIKGTIVHVDFLVVSRTETIQVNVEIVDIGEAPGVKQGGVVDHHLREVLVECFPQDVPEHLEADVSGMHIGDTLRLSSLTPPAATPIAIGPKKVEWITHDANGDYRYQTAIVDEVCNSDAEPCDTTAPTTDRPVDLDGQAQTVIGSPDVECLKSPGRRRP